MNLLDWLVLLGTILGIASYGMWRTRGRRDLQHYLKGDGKSKWITIGLTVMATQASAVTFLSTPGQGYQDGLGFVQNYFGAPFALILIAAVFLPIFRRLKVYTAYEYLGQRFDQKTRLLGAGLFLLQRGLGAGITIYAPAIVLSTVFGWRLDLTIVISGMVAIIYTVTGGSEAVTLTQKYQFVIIIAGMLAAFFILVAKLPPQLGLGDALTLAGSFHKLQAVDYSVDLKRRYTLWTGLLGGLFLALSYFGTDQTQVQRYISGASLRDSRMGLMFNAIFKIPMQFLILLLGTLLFVFYQFGTPPILFNQTKWHRVEQAHPQLTVQMQSLESQFDDVHSQKSAQVQEWIRARRANDSVAEETARTQALALDKQSESLRAAATKLVDEAEPNTKSSDADYVFITFILAYLPHGLIGLLVAVFFAATLSAKAAELNALTSTTLVDFYRHIIRTDAADAHYVMASKTITIFWGMVAIGFALFARMVENLIQAGNIVASLFYGVILGMFLVGFFLRWVRGDAVFYAAVVSQTLIFVLYKTLDISYLWYNVIGPIACVILSILIQYCLGSSLAPEAISSREDIPTA